MRNTITLNGVESSTIPGLLIQSLAPISKPLMRTEVETIDGRDGDITTNLGFSAYDKQITIGLFGEFDINQVIAYFNSKGTVIFSNEPDKFYNYQIVDQIDFERLVRYRTATVTMHCQPFKYSTTEGADILSTNDNFATLNQSLNTDTGFYTYSSNVQDDITAIRSGGSGGKFFAVFSVPVVQGVTYYFSGNGSKNISMYGYTNQLRGTSAGISGKGFNGYFTYTATFTGTMVLGFYSNATTEIFIRNFKVSNQSTSTVSGEGTNIVLENSAEAPFSRFDLKGNTEQTTYSGKNLLNDFATPSSNTLANAGITATVNADGTISTSGTVTTTYKNIRFDLQLPAGTYWFGGCPSGGSVDTYSFCVQPAGSGVIFDTGSGGTFTLSEEKWVAVYPVRLGGDTDYSMNGLVFKPMLTAGSTATTYEPYVGGTASPNPDYPQDVRVVTGYNKIKIIGKNVAHFVPNTNSYVLNGITPSYDSETGEISFSGTITATWSNIGALVQCSIPAGNYIVSTNDITDRYRKVIRLTYADGTYVNAMVAKGQKSGTVTTTKEVVSSYIYIDQATEGDVLNETYTLQLEKSSTITSFEPYKEQSLEVNLGKNMFDKNAIVNGSYINSDGTETSHGSFGISDYMPVQSGTKYAYSGSTNETGYGAKAAWYDRDKNIVGDAFGFGHNGIITAPSGASYVRFSVRVSVGDADTFQLEKGSSTTSYAPYFTPIELCKIGNYQDYFYKSGDKWHLHKEIDSIKLVGSQNWEKSSSMTSASRFFVRQVFPSQYLKNDDHNLAIMMSNYFTAISQNASDQANLGISQLNDRGIMINIQNGVFADATEFKAWLTAHDVNAYYVLATPTDTEVTNETLKAQLEAISQANSYRGRTHIVSIESAGNVPHIIAAEVATDPSGTITNSGNIYSKPKLTIFGSGNVGVYLNGVQMFQIALGTNDYITIDTALMEAYQDNLQTLKNRSVTGDYNNFKLPVGDSEISFSGTVTMCVVENYSRWL